MDTAMDQYYHFPSYFDPFNCLYSHLMYPSLDKPLVAESNCLFHGSIHPILIHCNAQEFYCFAYWVIKNPEWPKIQRCLRKPVMARDQSCQVSSHFDPYSLPNSHLRVSLSRWTRTPGGQKFKCVTGNLLLWPGINTARFHPTLTSHNALDVRFTV